MYVSASSQLILICETADASGRDAFFKHRDAGLWRATTPGNEIETELVTHFLRAGMRADRHLALALRQRGERTDRRLDGALAGSGATLLAGCGGGSEAADPLTPSGSAWTGYGGVGDYAQSNGNTEAVMTVAYEFSKAHLPGRTCLMLENHPVMGGEAKQNEFLVDGHRLTAPQGSNGGLTLKESFVKGSYGHGLYDVYTDYYRELGLPAQFDLEPLAGGAERYDIPNYHFAPMAPGSESGFETGYHFRGHGWVRNPARDKFASTPWPEAVRAQMDDYVHNRRDTLSGMRNAEAWLDTVTYYDLLDRLGYGAEVRRYIDPYIAVANFGVCGNAISALAAHRLGLPGTSIPAPVESGAADIGVVSFPGGNAAILRMMLARMIPGAITDDRSLAATVSSPIDFAAVDRAGAPLRIRLGATAIDVRHEGDPGGAEHVIVTYVHDGKIRKVCARSVVMASGGWVNRNIVRDLPDAHATAYADFHYGPVMTANVAVRNWRFFNKLGIIAARWFDGLGWHVSVRRNVAFGDRKPLTPDDPVVLTFYIPFLSPDLPATAQGPAGRQRLLATSYADFERQIRTLMMEMFGTSGFDARRDIAGIVLNRWGHAFCAPQPGFFFGRNGNPPPSEVIRQPHGRIVFAHSELQGLMSMAYAMTEAHRGATQALTML